MTRRKRYLKSCALGGVICLVSFGAGVQAQQNNGASTPPARSPAAQTDNTPAKPAGKVTNRAAPVEPPSTSTPRTGEDSPTGSPGGASEQAQTAKPSVAHPPVPVFTHPGLQGLTGGVPPPVLKPAARNPGEPDWRASQSPADPAFGAFQRGLYVAALREARKLADANPDNAAAMTLIGEIYRDGLGVKQDYTQALHWYGLAEARGDAQAAFALARAYVEGFGVKPDLGKAKTYFERAAAKNHPAALYNLGIMAIEGEIQDFRKAAEFFRRGMDYGDPDSTYSLAFLYRNGQGVEKDEEEATKLLRAGAEQHHLPAMIDYAISLFNGRGVEADEPGAAAYLIRAAWRNSPVAQNRLARMYVAGRGVKIDLVEAMKWHVLARANGLKDEWLDGKLTQLTPGQREIVEEAVRKFAIK